MSQPSAPRSFDDFRRDAGDGFARIFRIYGMSEILGHITGVLTLSTEPVSLKELARLLGSAKSTVSVAARRLESFGLVTRTRVRGDRQDYYQIQGDLQAVLAHLLRHFLLPEVEESRRLTQSLTEALLAPSGEGWPEGAAMDELRGRVQGLGAMTDIAGGFLGSLMGPGGVPDRERIGALIALLTQLQGGLDELSSDAE